MQAQHTIDYTGESSFKSYSLDERLKPLLIYKNAYNNAQSKILELSDRITAILSQSVDDTLRSELNKELNSLNRIQETLSESGLNPSINSNLNQIQLNINKHIISYNERIKKKELEEKRIAEEKAKKAAEIPKSWSGTGFALTSNYIVTNYHVIENAKSITIQGINGNHVNKYGATVIATDKNNDLAILKVNGVNITSTNIPYSVKTTTSEVGEEVFVLGYPLTATMGDEIKLTTGVVSSKSGFQGDVSEYQISAPIQPGNSGGPLFDSKGNVIGIVSAKHVGAENVGYAIKASYLRNLIESVKSTNILPLTNKISSLNLSGKVKAVKNYVYCITCSSTDNGILNYEGSSNSSGRTYNYPTTNRNMSNTLKVISVVVQDYQTILTLSDNNKNKDGGYYSWVTLDKNAYIVANGQRYTLRRAEGIALSPDKTYFHTPVKLRHLLYISPQYLQILLQLTLLSHQIVSGKYLAYNSDKNKSSKFCSEVLNLWIYIKKNWDFGVLLRFITNLTFTHTLLNPPAPSYHPQEDEKDNKQLSRCFK